MPKGAGGAGGSDLERIGSHHLVDPVHSIAKLVLAVRSHSKDERLVGGAVAERLESALGCDSCASLRKYLPICEQIEYSDTILRLR